MNTENNKQMILTLIRKFYVEMVVFWKTFFLGKLDRKFMEGQ